MGPQSFTYTTNFDNPQSPAPGNLTTTMQSGAAPGNTGTAPALNTTSYLAVRMLTLIGNWCCMTAATSAALPNFSANRFVQVQENRKSQSYQNSR